MHLITFCNFVLHFVSMKEIHIEDLLANIGDNLHSIRNAKKMTLEAVASEVGVKHPVLSRIENGRYESLNIALLVKLCNYYNVTIEQILGLKNMQIFNLSQNAASGNTTNNMRQIVNDVSNGYEVALDIAQKEIEYLRQMVDSLIRK